MIKTNLKDMKFNNRRLLIQSIIQGSGASRISLARETGLSPSAVSALVAELIEEGVLAESGLMVPTSGRSRKELILNPDYGQIAVFELSRGQTNLAVYDISLNKIDEKLIAFHRMSGNSLFSEICQALLDRFFEPGSIPLLGIGLLYMEDMIQSDVRVMYSTSVAADNISLRDALYTRFKVPIVGEYSAGEIPIVPVKSAEIRNSAHITIANSILVSITLDGRPLKMKDGGHADITQTLSAFGVNTPRAKAKEPRLFGRIAGLLAFLSGLFPLDLIFLSGKDVRRGNFSRRLREALGFIPGSEAFPPIELLESSEDAFSDTIAARIRNAVFQTDVFPQGG
jgi:DNA-binding Lrp family transcriptional regulator